MVSGSERDSSVTVAWVRLRGGGRGEGGVPRLPAPVLQLQGAVAAVRDCVLSYVGIEDPMRPDALKEAAVARV